jgi:predicted nucleotidyltransferase component of viral defense system
MLHYETVDEGTLGLLKQLQSLSILSEMRLVGRTSNRTSKINRHRVWNLSAAHDNLMDELKTIGEVVPLKNSKNIHSLLINNIKVDIVNYEYKWLTNKITTDNIQLATIEDIAAMKLNAIIGKGSKKDFIDLFFILKNYSLATIMEFYTKKYNDGSTFLVLKSLTYFEDADMEEMPFMFNNIDWQTIKGNIKKAHASYMLQNEGSGE